MDLLFYKPEKCKEKCTKDYDQSCMYNAQGQYICPKQKEELDVNQGWHFVMSEGQSHVLYKSDPQQQNQ